MANMRDVESIIDEHICAAKNMLNDITVLLDIAACWCRSLRSNGKLLLCGNGGSAGDCQHIAAELTGRFERTRPGLAAIALTTDSSALTAIANDFGYEHVFSRQLEAIGRPGDVLVAISTSGNSPSVLHAAEAAQRLQITVVGFTGSADSRLSPLCDHLFRARSDRTARVQEIHMLAAHILCRMCEDYLAEATNNA